MSSVKDRIAKLNAGSSGSSDTSKVGPKSPEVSKDGGETVNSDGTPVRRTSIADKIAALKGGGAAKPDATPEKSTPAKATPVVTPNRAVCVPIPPASAASSLKPTASTETKATAASPAVESSPAVPSDTTPKGEEKRSSIADRIAMMKSNSKAETSVADAVETPKKEEVRRTSIADRIAAMKTSSAEKADQVTANSGETATGEATAQKKVAKLGFNINIAGLMPGARPVIPKQSVSDGDLETTSAQKTSDDRGDGSIKHLSLQRPSVPSDKRKRAVQSCRLSCPLEDLALEIAKQDALNEAEANASAADADKKESAMDIAENKPIEALDVDIPPLKQQDTTGDVV